MSWQVEETDGRSLLYIKKGPRYGESIFKVLMESEEYNTHPNYY